MARNTKQGLDYFPLDVDFFSDPKIQYVRARFGLKGSAIAIWLLCKIYRNGYYIEFDEDAALLFATLEVGGECNLNLVNDVVCELVKRGFFDRSIFDRFMVLTSKGIQRRYIKALEVRKEVQINNDYWLIEPPKSTKKVQYVISSDENGIKSGGNEKESGENSQRKEKKSKVKESKEINKEHANIFFEEVWQLYPRKEGKCKVSAASKLELLGVGIEEIERAISRYEALLKKESWRSMMLGSTFFNGRYKDFLDENYKAQDNAPPEPQITEEQAKALRGR